jgi:nucleoside-diphosphate-sugar epimerase
MKVLITGRDGLIEAAAVAALTQHGHEIVTALEGSDAVVCIAGAADAVLPDAIETSIVEGTRAALGDAVRSGVRRFVLVSALGAQDGASATDRGKHRAESLVREWTGSWTICRVGPVYGPGDRTVSLLLRAVRTLPAIPVLDELPFQPVWAADLGEALARVIERDDLGHQTLELAGPEAVTLRDLVKELSALTGMTPRLVRVSGWIAQVGRQAVQTMGLESKLDAGVLTSITDHAAIPKGRSNALVGELGVKPIPLRDGLRLLIA